MIPLADDVRFKQVLEEFVQLAQSLARNRRSRLSQFFRALADDYITAFEGADDHTFQGEVMVLDRLARFLQESDSPHFAGKNLVFFDLGALYGDWTAFVLERFPEAKVIAVEMDHRAYPRLEERFKDHANVITVHAAVAPTSGELRYRSYRRPEISTLTDFNYPEAEGQPTLRKVLATPGDEFVRQHVSDNEQIAYIKIDCEGYDYSVLLSFKETLENRKPWIVQFEYGPICISSRVFLKDFYQLLGKHGYLIGKIYHPEGVLFRPYSYDQEKFLLANYLAVQSKHMGLVQALIVKPPGG